MSKQGVITAEIAELVGAPALVCAKCAATIRRGIPWSVVATDDYVATWDVVDEPTEIDHSTECAWCAAGAEDPMYTAYVVEVEL